MKAVGRWIGFGLIGLVLAAAALVLFAPVGGFKAPLEARVSAASGSSFRIEGPISLTFTPELALDLGPVTLGGADGAPLLTARRAVLAVAFFPLLGGEAQPTALTLEGADIVLNAVAPKDGPPPVSPFDALAFGDLRLVDSRIHAGDLVIAAADLRLRWPQKGETVRITGDIGFRDQVFTVEALVERREALMRGGRTPLRVEFDGALAHGSLDGSADFGRLGFEGGVSLSAPSTRTLAGFLGAAIPGDRAFGELSLSAAAKAEPGKLVLRDAKFALGEMTGAGTLTVGLNGDRPDVFGRVAVDRFTLSDFLAFTPLEGGAGWRDLAFDLSGLAGFDADLTVKARSADLAGLAVQNLGFTLSGRAGGFRLRIESALAYAAMFNAELTVEDPAGTPRFGLTLAADGMDMQALAAAAFEASGLSGRANLKLDLTANGATRRALIASLWGSADIVLIDGALDGIDPAEIARTAAEADGPKGVGGEAAVAFRRLSAAFRVQAGHALTDTLRLVTRHLRLDAAGDFDLPARRLTLKATPAFTADAEGRRDPADEGRLAIPFVVSGAWGAVAAAPDWDGLIAALQAGKVAPEDIELLPEPARSQFKARLAGENAAPPPAAEP